MGTVHIPTLLEGILEATAAEAHAKARISTLRAALEAEARARFVDEGAAPSWNAPALGKVRLDPPTDWSALVVDRPALASYVAEHYPTEATATIELAGADLADALQALEFIGVTTKAYVDVRPAWLDGYLSAVEVEVEETFDDSAQRRRIFTVTDPDVGAVVPGLTGTRTEAKLVVSLDRDRRTAAITEARTTATALVDAATDDADDVEANLDDLDERRVALEGLDLPTLKVIAKGHDLGQSGTKAELAERIARAEVSTGRIVRPASSIPSPLPEGTEVEEVSTVPTPEPAIVDQPVEEVPGELDAVIEVEQLGSREVLRGHAKRLGVPASGTKRAVAVALVVAGHTADTLTAQESTP